MGECRHFRGKGRGLPPGSETTLGRPSLAPILLLCGGGGAAGQSTPAPEACEDFLPCAFLTWHRAQSRLPTSVDRCQVDPALPPSWPPALLGSLLHPLQFSLLFCLVRGPSAVQTLSQHLSVTCLGLKAPRWDSPLRPRRPGVLSLSHTRKLRPKQVEREGECQQSRHRINMSSSDSWSSAPSGVSFLTLHLRAVWVYSSSIAPLCQEDGEINRGLHHLAFLPCPCPLGPKTEWWGGRAQRGLS